MATYIVLMNYTEKGIQAMKDVPKRLEKVREILGQAGVRLTSFHLTMGHYDGVTVVDAADDTSLARALLTIAALGNVRTETLRAFDETEAAAIVSTL
jgi:uncharacterized protein with GYD domain